MDHRKTQPRSMINLAHSHPRIQTKIKLNRATKSLPPITGNQTRTKELNSILQSGQRIIMAHGSKARTAAKPPQTQPTNQPSLSPGLKFPIPLFLAQHLQKCPSTHPAESVRRNWNYCFLDLGDTLVRPRDFPYQIFLSRGLLDGMDSLEPIYRDNHAKSMNFARAA
ncbi:hypothetical protein PAAG_07927 [Paracoccidioides lutzii Pb01]|uniref:Uncharacterized protein n=1 Tax=Paracoccidioides lutzii (strain ATCC MYA-826 / Pb01) TaxID=502779 RepID=C1HAU8_PARBA|nr:hypothetical protein PAAG_07927 [Paracoccidioides lutzii Pb01]EEH37509.2 hypothetical protein PAAG_07927 [Paracoccidioides lutzii Pb01]